ncbi:MAG: pyrroline-5-carboxylate reductase [Propionibacteriaceae bacterium]|nr:pyrroline-5-carboxylate reductase [Propionibacteriaceae bacterium]
MRVAMCGAGAMGEALLAGWLAAGMEPSEAGFVEVNDARAADIAARYGVRRIELADAAAAPVIVLAVKPHQIIDALTAISPTRDSVVVSIAAGVPLARLEAACPGVACVRVMPNTPALVGQGMSGIVGGTSASEDDVATVAGLLGAVGKTVVVTEDQLDALTAISGSGPAYLFYIAEAMIEAGVHLGLTRADATALVNQTFVGSATMLAESGETATALRERVTSPAGTTAAALGVLDERAVRAAFNAAMRACRDRGAEMASAAKPR